MDPIRMEKLQAVKKYRKIQFLQDLFQYCLTALVIALCISKSVWLRSQFSSMNNFFFTTLPTMGGYIVGPKCLFIVCNLIVAILVGESKLARATGTSLASDFYDEYVRHTRSLRRLSSPDSNQRGEKQEASISSGIREKEKEVEEEEDEEMMNDGEELEGEEEVDTGLTADELYKRAEEFIARVNQQRKQEARLLVSCG